MPPLTDLRLLGLCWHSSVTQRMSGANWIWWLCAVCACLLGAAPVGRASPVNRTRAAERGWFQGVSIPRVTTEDLGLPGNEDLLRGARPFVLTNGMRGFEALTDLDDMWMDRMFGSSVADLFENNLGSPKEKQFLVPLSRAIDSLRKGQVGGRSQYTMLRMNYEQTALVRQLLLPSFPDLFDSSWWMRKCLGSADARNNAFLIAAWSMLVLGGDEAGMFLHYDSLNTGTWQMQISGVKTWLVCDPAGRDWFYEPGDVFAFDPNLESFPRFDTALRMYCAAVEVHPGETLFYPSNWWHATYNEGWPTIGLVGRTITRWNFQPAFAALKAKCETPGKDISKIWRGECGVVCRARCLRVRGVCCRSAPQPFAGALWRS
jgi:hypothetical protein